MVDYLKTSKVSETMEAAVNQASKKKYDLDQQVGFLLRLASQRHSTIFQKHALENLTPTQFSTLIRLSEMGEISQNHLGRIAAMDVATVKGVVDRLKTKGLVDSRPDQIDKRRAVITLTEKGSALVRDLEVIGKDITQETLSPLTANEQRNLVNLLRKIS
ncbi:putative MarR family transcriptional regulator [Octadecabacter antarcticus 307]|uniref:Putative MarR family transcriptional regulator n=1 Tax=Octadecabacter antarcticus 307 TaxID=391626 RepID=M9R6R1_9RHOB|nr:MarR family transcriptional regulator [Octadecabacter antarcticus]AGI67917.1 putative MarR family transcriptional regulator [Octadecabacter antarcticus 307]